MIHPRSITAALAVGAAVVAGAGPASAEPPNDWAPNPPSLPVLTMSTPEVVEGTGGANEMVFEFTLDEPAAGGESFRFYTQDGQGSALPVEDHEPMLEFPELAAGETSLTVGIPLVTDSAPEANEHILVTIDHPEGLTIPDEDGTGIIIDDDIPTLTIDDVALPEGTGGPTGFHFTVSLSEPSTVDVYVEATPTAGTAAAGSDWQAFPQLVQFAPGETTQDVVVSVVGDDQPEPDEKFTVQLSEADYATIADSSGVGTILDDDDLKITGPTTTSTRPRPGELVAPTTTVRDSSPSALLDTTLASSDKPSDGEPPLDLRPAAAVVLVVIAAYSLITARRLFHR